MKKYAIIFIIVFSFSLLGACGDKTNYILDIEVEKNVYENQKITISYPQVTRLPLSDTINQTIKEDALSILNDYSEELENLSTEIKYSFEIINEKILSICFEGFAYVKNAAYPLNSFFTCNIDVSTGKRITFEDLLEITPDLVEAIKANARYLNNEANEELTTAINQEWNNYNTVRMLEDIKNGNIYVYLKQNSLGISLPVLHTLGDYANFEVDYKYITHFLKF